MKIIDIVKQLRSKGFHVEYRTRSDYGVLITQIGHRRFKGAKGNIEARSMVGVSLSAEKIQHLEKLQRSKTTRAEREKVVLSKELKEAINRVQRMKASAKAKAKRKGQKFESLGTLSRKEVAKQIASGKITEQEALENAKNIMMRYKGIAYDENIRMLVERLRTFARNVGVESDFDWYIAKIESTIGQNKFYDEWIPLINNAIYEAEEYAFMVQGMGKAGEYGDDFGLDKAIDNVRRVIDEIIEKGNL